MIGQLTLVGGGGSSLLPSDAECVAIVAGFAGTRSVREVNSDVGWTGIIGLNGGVGVGPVAVVVGGDDGGGGVSLLPVAAACPEFVTAVVFAMAVVVARVAACIASEKPPPLPSPASACEMSAAGRGSGCESSSEFRELPNGCNVSGEARSD